MKKEVNFASPENCLCFNLRWVARAVTHFYEAELRRHGLRPTQTPVLNALAAKADWSMEQLSHFLGLERTTLVRNLRPLERNGLVALTGTGRGGRVSISITAKGRREVEKITPAWKSAQKAVVKTLGEQRWSAILSDLHRAAAALND